MFGGTSAGYDRTQIMFSPEGRIIQTEYARAAMAKGKLALGIKSKNGVLLAGLLKVVELDEPNHKIFKIDEHVDVVFSGYVADGRVLINKARVEAQVHKLTYDEPVDIKGLVTTIGNHVQAFTQQGGVRPFGVGLIFGGIDLMGPQLYFVDPGGGVFACKAKAIGEKSAEATKLLKEKYKEDLTIDEMINITREIYKTVYKDLDLKDEEIEIVTHEFTFRDENKNNQEK